MAGFAGRFGTGLVAVALGCGTAAAQGWQHLGKVQRVEKLKDGVELSAGSAKVRITAFRDGIFRVRVTPNGTFPKDFSWAVIESPQPAARPSDRREPEGNSNHGGERDRHGAEITTARRFQGC